MTHHTTDDKSEFLLSDDELKKVIVAAIENSKRVSIFDAIKILTPYLLTALALIGFLFKNDVYGGMNEVNSRLNEVNIKIEKIQPRVTSNTGTLHNLEDKIVDLKEYVKERFDLLEKSH